MVLSAQRPGWDPSAACTCACSELAALEREALYYGLPDLAAACTAALQQAGSTSGSNGSLALAGGLLGQGVGSGGQQHAYDSLYLETGFSSIEGSGLREMEARKVSGGGVQPCCAVLGATCCRARVSFPRAFFLPQVAAPSIPPPPPHLPADGGDAADEPRAAAARS